MRTKKIAGHGSARQKSARGSTRRNVTAVMARKAGRAFNRPKMLPSPHRPGAAERRKFGGRWYTLQGANALKSRAKAFAIALRAGGIAARVVSYTGPGGRKEWAVYGRRA